jgi:hypothetical protein
MAVLLLPGTAQPGDVLAGKSFSAGANYGAVGSMPENGAVILTPSGTGNVPIPAGHHNGAGYVQQVNVPAANVLSGTTIAGVAGTMPNQAGAHRQAVLVDGTSTPHRVYLKPSVGYYDGVYSVYWDDPNFDPANIKSGVSIFGIAGSVTPRQFASGTLTSSTTQSAFNFDDGSIINAYCATVSGLTFQPTIIVVVGKVGAPTIYVAGQNFSPTYNNSPIRLNTACYQLTSSAYVNGSGFQLPCLVSGQVFNWYAWV